MQKIKSEIEAFFEANANPSAAVKMQAYMKDNYVYYGINAPTRKTFFTQLWKDHKLQLQQNWQKLTTWLWLQDERENQYLAMDLLAKVEKSLDKSHLKLIEGFIITKSWWDTVDFLASHLIGQILKGDALFRMETADRFIKSDNMWLQRSAVIFQLFYKKDTDSELLFSLIDQTLGSKEFFINKATGWALRQYSRIDPVTVREYIDMQRPQMAGLTIREGSKFL